jgi:hypothetical protein
VNWFEKSPSLVVCSPYQLVRNVHGWAAYIYSKEHSGRIADRMSLARAKEVCKEHKAKAAACP